MRKGTIAVRAQLPDNAKHVTDEQIHESLWHYYYDVEQSVAYLVKKFGKKAEKVKASNNGRCFPFHLSVLLGGLRTNGKGREG